MGGSCKIMTPPLSFIQSLFSFPRLLLNLTALFFFVPLSPHFHQHHHYSPLHHRHCTVTATVAPLPPLPTLPPQPPHCTTTTASPLGCASRPGSGRWCPGSGSGRRGGRRSSPPRSPPTEGSRTPQRTPATPQLSRTVISCVCFKICISWWVSLFLCGVVRGGARKKVWWR